MERRLPEFLIIGAGKSGTTTLYQYLCMHPDIFMCTPKEPEFFARDDVFEKGIDWYSQLFQDARNNQLCGEASTIYSLWPHFPNTATRLSSALPNAKLIYIMRNPVDRAYSFYVQLIKSAQNENPEYKINRSFEECIFPRNDKTNKSDFFASFQHYLPDCAGLYLDGSDYVKQIKQYERYYLRDNMLLLLFEDLLEDPLSITRLVFNFLGVDDSVDVVRNNPVNANSANAHLSRKLDGLITRKLQAIPGAKSFSKILPESIKSQTIDFVKSLPFSENMRSRIEPKPMKPETRQWLLNQYEQSNKKLSELLKRDLSQWNN